MFVSFVQNVCFIVQNVCFIVFVSYICRINISNTVKCLIKNNNMLKIKEICAKKGMLITELAEKMQIHQNSLSRIISTGNTKQSTLNKMAEILGVTVKELYGETSTLHMMDEEERGVLKKIILNIPTKFGPEEVGYIIYKRPLSNNYKVKEYSEDINFFGGYPEEKSFPHDEFDELMLNSVKNIYPKSRMQSKLLLFNTDREYISRLMDIPSEKGRICILPFVTYNMLKMNPSISYSGYEISIDVYMICPYESLQTHFSSSFNIELKNVLKEQYSTIVFLLKD